MTLNILLLLTTLFLGGEPKPVSIYVSPQAGKIEDGSRRRPYSDIGRAQQQARRYAGKRTVEVVFTDGTYYLSAPITFNPEDSGSKEFPVVYKAENEGKAVISGGTFLQPQWEPWKDGIFVASVDADLDQLYVNGQRQRMARFPNAVEGKNVFDTWDLIDTRKPDPANDPLAPERVARWSNPEGAYVHAMHISLWGDMHWLVKGKKADGTLDLEGGWQNNRPSPMHPRYRMVENVFEELDAPGEWFYNKTERKLYYFPTPGTDLQKAKIEIVRLKQLVEFEGTAEKPVRFIHLEGLVFRQAARSFMENKEQLLRSDWTISRTGAVYFTGAEDCAVTDCEFDQVGGNTVMVSNYNRRLAFQRLYIHNSGANGIAFVGDPATVRNPLFRYGPQDYAALDFTPGPLGNNYPADCLVEDCLITLTGRDEKQTSPVQISISHKITVSHCSLYDVPRAGINISEGTFGGHLIEYCDVFNTVLETGDHGSFNSWGRDRYWTPDIRETNPVVEKHPELPHLDMIDGNIIRNSRWRCDHGWDIDLDDGSGYYQIYNNLLLAGGLKLREGYGRQATNNVIVNNTLHPHVWYKNSGDVFKHNIVFAAYLPALMNLGIAADGKWGSEIDYNLFAASEEQKNKFAANDCDHHSLTGDPMFVDAANGDFRVKEGSPALAVGFKNFDMNQFGVRPQKLKRLAKTPEIPAELITAQTGESITFEWLGARAKNVETLGEQSAAGLPNIAGVLLVAVPENSALYAKGFRQGDVILAVGGIAVDTFEQLGKQLDQAGNHGSFRFEISRNQQKQELRADW